MINRFSYLLSIAAIATLILLLPAPAAARSEKQLDAEFYRALELYAANRTEEAIERFLAPLSSRKDTLVLSRWRQLALEVGEERPEALVPIAGLYSRVHVELLTPRNLRQAHRVVQDIERFLERYVARSSDPAADETASRMLSQVAIQVRDMESLFHALPLLRQAVEVDPDSEIAHHLLVTLLEKRGALDATHRALEHWLEKDPEHAEARLRWAVVQGRRGEIGPALECFEELIEAPVEPWIKVLAVQESARLLAVGGQKDEALARLDAGLERFPGDETLLLLRAFLTGEDLEASRPAVAELVTRPWRPQLTPRAVYNNWPVATANRLRSQLVADVVERLPAVVEALEAVKEEG